MKFEKIISIKEIEPRESYELEVEDNHNFFANDFLKHNCKLSKYDDKFYVFTNGMFLSKNNSGAPVETTVHPEYGFKTIGDIILYCLNSKGFNNDGSIIISEN